MLHLAIGFDEKSKYPAAPRSKQKVSGYRLRELEYLALTKALPQQAHLIPRRRIATYHYVTITPDSSWYEDSTCIVVPIQEALLPTLETYTKRTYKPRLYLWRDGQWWKFPQIEDYKTGEKETHTYTSRAIFGGETTTTTYTTDKYATRITDYTPTTSLKLNPPPSAAPPATQFPNEVAPATSTETRNPAGYPVTIRGNGMILEWKRGYQDRPPIWWIRDEREVPKAQSATYRHYDTIKANPNTRWSKHFKAWYYTGGGHPPQAWLDLVGYTLANANATPLPPPSIAPPSEPIPNAQPTERTDQPSTTPPPTPPAAAIETFQERMARIRREIEEKHQREQALAEAMKPYHEFHARRQIAQTLAEITYNLKYNLEPRLALPEIATPALDDPWS